VGPKWKRDSLKSNIVWVVLGEPVASLLDGLVEWSEFEVGQVLSKFVVASGLFELAIRSGSVVDPLAGEETGKIDGVDELSAGFAGSPDGEGLVLLSTDVELVHKTGDDVRLFEVEVIVWAENVCGDD